CVNKRGLSKAPWQLDAELAEIPAFYFDFKPEGLHERDDLMRLDTQDLVAAFDAAASEGIR
ncbi:MAG TPA: hypothetical protein PLQ29_00800, partial [Spirochaetales bacterium]|nr:hypothetical protein [Spirochaetales bacterium]